MARRLLSLLFLVTAATTLLPLKSYAHCDSLSRVFTAECPLIYEDAWDLWPYSFLDEHGVPQGYNIDLVRMICEKMGVPYEIHLKPTRDALKDLSEGCSDLMLGMKDKYHAGFAHWGNSVVVLFTHSVVYPKTQAAHIKSMADLRTQKAIVHRGSFSHYYMLEHGADQNIIPYDDMKEAVQDVSSRQKGQIIWNTMSLKWLLRKFQMDDLQLASVDMPHGEYRFLSRDTVLLQRIDQTFNKIRSDYQFMESLQNRWFYPENEETGIPSWVWYIAGAMALVALFFAFTIIFYHNKEQKFTALSRQRTKRLSGLLKTSNVRIWTYDVQKQMFAMIGQDGLPAKDYTFIEFTTHFHRSDFERLSEALHKIITQEQPSITLELKAFFDNGTEKMIEREMMVTLTVLHRKRKQVTVVMGTGTDVTEERQRQRSAKMLMNRYHSIFNTAMVDMIYFDHEGYLTSMNQRAQRTFGISLEEAVSQKLHYQDFHHLGDLDIHQLGYFHATQLLNKNHPLQEPCRSGRDANAMFYELQLVPLYNDQQLLGIYSTGRNVSEYVKSFRHQKESIEMLDRANKEMLDYVRNIDYVMKVGSVRIVTYSPKEHTLTIFSEIGVTQLTLTQSRCVTLVADPMKKRIMRLLSNMDNGSTTPIDEEVSTTLRIGGMPLYLEFHFIPLTDSQGQVKHYIGMCRDISEMKATELQLETETERAKGIEELKNSFLRNMSYEIRTPLTTVVGFSELFEMEHAPDDEDIFIQEIKNNAAHLLRLINDILFLSRLDAHMIDIVKQPTDFAKTFDGHCQLGWSNHQKPGVRYIIVNHYEQLVVDIDDANLGRVIEQIAANAAQHTESGTVRSRFDYVGGKLIIGIDDTGSGIDKYHLESIYQRFNNNQQNGTGLGLPICKELTEQMGGTIEVNSEVGKGTTVWISIPCTASAIERKNEII